MMREKRDIRPVLLKFGVAIALSLGGILYSILRNKRIKPSLPPPPPPPSDSGNQLEGGKAKTVMKDDHHASQTASISPNPASLAPDKHDESCLCKVSPGSSVTGLSPSSRYSGVKDGFLLPEFNELAKGFNLATTKAILSPKKDVEIPHSDVDMPRAFNSDEKEDYEVEIKNLKNMVRVLRERERTLEIQLLEYYGLKEQETAVMELQNRLKINNIESKLFNLKIESLQADNRRLESQVADYGKAVAELEAARAKIKLMKKKFKSQAEQNKEQILNLQERVRKLQNQEHEVVATDRDWDIHLKLQRLKELEDEAEELRKCNHSLQLENSDLAQKLECTQMLAHSVLEDEETVALKEESQKLRQKNVDLSEEIERLQADRCADAEELVYLRWINACLRYELRDYQPRPGKTIARDLSKTLSPKSEQKAKQLIVDYANKEGSAERGARIPDSDLDQWSSSHSYLTDSGEFDDSSVDNSSANKRDMKGKTKFLTKLRRLVQGKDMHGRSPNSSLERSASADDIHSPGVNLGTLSENDKTDGQGNRLRSSSLGSSEFSVDPDRLRSPKEEYFKDSRRSSRNSHAESSYIYRSISSGRESIGDSTHVNQLHENLLTAQKSELMKYAEVLKDSSGGRPKFPRRSASYSSF